MILTFSYPSSKESEAPDQHNTHTIVDVRDLTMSDSEDSTYHVSDAHQPYDPFISDPILPYRPTRRTRQATATKSDRDAVFYSTYTHPSISIQRREGTGWK